MVLKSIFILLCLQFKSINTFAAQPTETKGLLPEVVLDTTDEDKNQNKLYTSELLITKTEKKAIESLKKIIEKKKNQPEEADLLYRLAELYMRHAKSGRFFDQNKDLSRKTTLSHSASESLNEAIKNYSRILNQYPKFENTDAALFNIALAHMQLNQVEKAKTYLTRLTTDFKRSPIYPDALLELGELYYNQQNMSVALEEFKKIEAFPQSKAYPYGVYKSAWCFYNLKDNTAAIKKLKTILAENPADSSAQTRFNLRKEALQDMTLFVEDHIPADQLYSFFKEITSDKEFSNAMLNLTNLYESHSHHKEINIFLKEYIDKNQQDPQVSKFYVKLIEVNETIKARETVLGYMQKLADHCTDVVSDPNISLTCKTDFKKVSLDISKKWWEIWLKNKKHVEFSNLTEKAFEILLSKDEPLKPDSASRFAYAELLFQIGKYDKAAQNYEQVSEDKSFDSGKRHDALYGAIYSIDKLNEADKKNEPLMAANLQKLTARYIQEFPKGEYIEPLSFKLGFLSYKQQDTEGALKYLSPIAIKAKDANLKLKSEDIILDIYNLKKDYKSLQKFSQNLLSQGKLDDNRKKSLQLIKEEAQFAQMQIDMQTLPAEKRIDSLLSFANENKSSKLAKEALWQSISLAYANNLDVKGADLSLAYYNQFPNDPKSLDSLKDALKSYTEAGYINESIKTLDIISKLEPQKSETYKEMSCDLLHINNQISDTQSCLQSLLPKADKAKKLVLLEKLKETLTPDQNLSDIKGLESFITKENIEPYVTYLLIGKARAFLQQGKTQEAFQLSSRINSRDVDSDVRAEARLIQAEILEKEFVGQSVKSSEAKFALVLSLKTEKLDKAYTAYTSTIKMAKNPKTHEKALRGIDRLYTNFIDSLNGMPIPKTLSKNDQEALKAELAKMTQPFIAKKQENLNQIASLTKSNRSESGIVWNSLAADKTVSPQPVFPDANKLQIYIPSEFTKYSRLPSESLDAKKCDIKNTTAQSIGTCILTKKLTQAESIAKTLSADKQTRSLGFYYMSVIADLNKQDFKSQWFIEKALKLDESVSMFNYQKGKMIYTAKGLDAALPYFEKSIDLKRSSKEISLISGIKSFSDKDFISASDELKKLSLEDQNKFNISTLVVESTAQKGNSAEAIKLAEKYISSNPKNIDMYLQLGRLFEEFPENPQTGKKQALEIYQKALAKSDNNEQKDWLKRKISFLSEAQ